MRTDEESSVFEEVRITSEQSRSCRVSVAINQVSNRDCLIAYLCRVKGGILRNCNDFKPLTKLRKATYTLCDSLHPCGELNACGGGNPGQHATSEE